MRTINGIGASPGIAIGVIEVYGGRFREEVIRREIEADKVSQEVRRFQRAIIEARRELRGIKKKIPAGAPAEIAAFIDTHLLMLDDEMIARAPLSTIRNKRCNAEWALRMARDGLVQAFDAMDDDYLRTRRDDVDHVIQRVFARLASPGAAKNKILFEVDDKQGAGKKAVRDRIVYAEDLSPADTLQMPHDRIAGFITGFGGPNSHTAILARSLDIPAVVGLQRGGGTEFLQPGEEVIIDGREGSVVVGPDSDRKRTFNRQKREIARIRAVRRKLRRAPTISADGEKVSLQANVELPGTDIASALLRDKVAGIGLCRTEYLFLNRETPPEEQEQYEVYCDLLARLKGAEVTFRTLDLGADRPVEGMRTRAPAAASPALGLRAVRLCLKNESLFRPQIRALLRAAAKGPVRMMIPMLATIDELDRVLKIVRECEKELDDRGEIRGRQMPVGAMIEVPAAAVCADIFAKHLDFLSIGTNDLIQYTLAIDRVDDEVSDLYDPLHPAVLRLISTTIAAGRKAGIPVSMCGEMAGDARCTKLLLGMGLREFSVHPSALLEIRQAIGAVRIPDALRLARHVVRAARTKSRRSLLEILDRDLTTDALSKPKSQAI
ncbi:phosphoenolpyruvate--protein phosphotransferase [Thioalkalivibrio sp. HK1]|uniref:phosphoenolpyruvate--protein phosphotransferase n=1 Tax=Thioalkalivibrio sp. HK1 TaxID=1469245 RepID=UPI00046F2A4F|nr:phosphoenolpyruvate--protein phosphotransferase [Thioalkalivibrio sp. HK1]